MKNKSEEIVDLADVLQTTAVIECCKCHIEEKLNFFDNTFDIAEVLYDNGWRLIENVPYCKNCK